MTNEIEELRERSVKRTLEVEMFANPVLVVNVLFLAPAALLGLVAAATVVRLAGALVLGK